MPNIYLPVLRDAIERSIAESSSVKVLALAEARSKFEEIETQFYKDFESHPVTQELKSAKGESTSGAITGPPGSNLFSYIGFKTSPIRELKAELKKRIRFKANTGKVVRQTNGLAFAVDIDLPTNEDLYEKTPYPDKWEPGKSWLYGIENGIAGVYHYLTRQSAIRRGNKKNLFARSRSGEAVQVKQELKQPALFSPVSYITSLLSNLRSKFRGKGGRFV